MFNKLIIRVAKQVRTGCKLDGRYPFQLANFGHLVEIGSSCSNRQTAGTKIQTMTNLNFARTMDTKSERSHEITTDEDESVCRESESESDPNDSLATNLNLSPEMDKKLQLIKLEMEITRQSGEYVPPDDELSERDWRELLGMDTRSRRRKYYNYLAKRAGAQRKAKRRKQEKHQQWLTLKEQRTAENEGHIQYGLDANTIYYYVRESTMVRHYNHGLARAIVFGQPLVFDMSYDPDMTPRERRNTSDQIQHVWASNKIDPDPYYINFCNIEGDASKESTLHYLRLSVPPLASPICLANMTEKSYLDIFPKERLVYLTPHCQEELTHYNHDDIYIIGALVDMAVSKPLSLAKAKREGLRMAKLPLDRYLQWEGSKKTLTLDQMVKILLDMKSSGDWNQAFQWVPRRKLKKDDSGFDGVVERKSISKSMRDEIAPWNRRRSGLF